MENLSHFPKTVHGYLELLAHHTKAKNTPSPWPGDNELLTAYNVTPADILKNLLQKMADANFPQKISEASFKGEDAQIEFNLNDHYKITAYVKYASNSQIASYLKIHNIKKEMELTVPFSVLSLLEQDNLGDKPGLNIDPTIACKVLELGNTELPINSPLYNVAQYGKEFFIEQASSH